MPINHAHGDAIQGLKRAKSSTIAKDLHASRAIQPTNAELVDRVISNILATLSRTQQEASKLPTVGDCCVALVELQHSQSLTFVGLDYRDRTQASEPRGCAHLHLDRPALT
jgi:hypothetical protein